MTIVFATKNSTYEVDLTAKQIRRRGGVNPPTPWQGADGIWQDFASISPLHVGERAVICWKDRPDAEVPATITSRIGEMSSGALE